jgi:hypothetical protein
VRRPTVPAFCLGLACLLQHPELVSDYIELFPKYMGATHRPLEHVTIRSRRNASDEFAGLGSPCQDVGHGREALPLVMMSTWLRRSSFGGGEAGFVVGEETSLDGGGPEDGHCSPPRSSSTSGSFGYRNNHVWRNNNTWKRALAIPPPEQDDVGTGHLKLMVCYEYLYEESGMLSAPYNLSGVDDTREGTTHDDHSPCLYRQVRIRAAKNHQRKERTVHRIVPSAPIWPVATDDNGPRLRSRSFPRP